MALDPTIGVTLPRLPALDAAAIRAVRNSLPGKLLGRTAAILAAAVLVLAPHHYTTDRFCVVVSGTWWCNSGADFDPAACVPVPAGSFVHRVAGTPHYDGVVRGHSEPAIIAICGVGPANFVLIDPSQPGVRRV
jgi:hypothetical protein